MKIDTAQIERGRKLQRGKNHPDNEPLYDILREELEHARDMRDTWNIGTPNSVLAGYQAQFSALSRVMERIDEEIQAGALEFRRQQGFEAREKEAVE